MKNSNITKIHTLLLLYAYIPPLVLSSIEPMRVEKFMTAARAQLRPELPPALAAFFSSGINA